MAVTNFSKPIDDEVGALNSNKANAIINAHSTLGTDLNTYTTTGMYGIEGATNCPTGYAYGTLTVTRYSSSAYVTQIWQSVIEEKFFIRHSFNGTWQPWEQLALNSKIKTNDITSLFSFNGYTNVSSEIGNKVTIAGNTVTMSFVSSKDSAGAMNMAVPSDYRPNSFRCIGLVKDFAGTIHPAFYSHVSHTIYTDTTVAAGSLRGVLVWEC